MACSQAPEGRKQKGREVSIPSEEGAGQTFEEGAAKWGKKRISFRQRSLHRGDIGRLEGAWGPIKGPSVGVVHMLRLSAGENTVVNEIREGLKGVLPRVEAIMVLRRDLTADLTGEKEGKDREEVVKGL